MSCRRDNLPKVIIAIAWISHVCPFGFYRSKQISSSTRTPTSTLEISTACTPHTTMSLWSWPPTTPKEISFVEANCQPWIGQTTASWAALRRRMARCPSVMLRTSSWRWSTRSQWIYLWGWCQRSVVTSWWACLPSMPRKTPAARSATSAWDVNRFFGQDDQLAHMITNTGESN